MANDGSATLGDKDPWVGRTLLDRYEVVRRLGSGGMGSVYEGRHTLIGKRVAIKILHANFAAHQETLKRFLNEARAAATLRHPHIIDAADVGEAPTGEPFLVLEFLEGHDLDHRIKTLGPLPIARAVHIVQQVCDALATAHEHGIVHRDMKPENVFLIRQGNDDDWVKILDFGISKFTTDELRMTRAGASMGTPYYMPPEQVIDSSRIDHRADVYSTGVMLYQMLAGRVPFEAGSFPELMGKILTVAPPSLTTFRSDLPPALEDVVMRALAKDREQRWPSMRDLSTALAPFAAVPDAIRSASEAPPSAIRTVGGPRRAPTAADGTRLVDTLGATVAPRRCPSCNEGLGNEVVCPFCGAALDDPRLGRIIADRYRIDRLLGVGGVGRVYVGTHLTLSEPVAIKFLLAEWTTRGDFRARFRREAVTLARLRHPGIVSVHDYGEFDGELFMVMELVKGRPLRDVAPEGQAIAIPRALELVDLLLQVIEFAHAQNIVHRDLKPENVMLLDLGEQITRLKVLDFGLALATDAPGSDRLTAAGTVQGTPAYMSPEQCKGGLDVGPPTDVYAIGVMLFEMIAGEAPFVGNTFAETIVRHMFVEPPRMAERGMRPETPAPVEDLVRAALRKDPATRPTASELRAMIGQVLRGEDPTSLAEKAAAAKVAAVSAPREDRGLAASSGQSRTTTSVAGKVALWDLPRETKEALRVQLSVAGASPFEWTGEMAPHAMIDGQQLKAILVTWSTDGQRHLHAVKARADLAKVPVIVIGASDVDDVPAIIRAGAADVGYRSTAPDALARQVQKIMRRVK